MKKIRALSIFSGGLDSILSVLVLRKQGIEIEGVYLETPFFSSERARKSAQKIGIPLRIMDITDEMLSIIKDPKFGYGTGLNPCLDCHLLMATKACEIMKKEGFDFIFTGEVLGQRPVSQTKKALLKIKELCGCGEYLLLPLSAKHLPITLPEMEGKVNRDRLLDIHGRSRNEQLKLAKSFGIDAYPSPAGGCLLTDKVFSGRLKDLLTHQKEIKRRDLRLLKLGRHFRLNPLTKAIVGRNKRENEDLISLVTPKDSYLNALKYPGPLVLLPYGGDNKGKKQAAILAASYSDAPSNIPVTIKVSSNNKVYYINALSQSKTDLRKFMIKAYGKIRSKNVSKSSLLI